MTPAEKATITRAIKILDRHLKVHGEPMNDPRLVKSYLRMKMQTLSIEKVYALYLDSQLRLIECEMVARGTINQASVYPREIVKAAIKHNASAVILAHNHPSGSNEASQADIALTRTLKKALELIDVRLLDHMIVAGGETVSLAQQGRM